MAYKTQGYDRGDAVGPITVLRNAPVDMSRARALQERANVAMDPQERERFAILSALEAKYAQGTQAAQQGVQDATLAPGGDLIYGSPQQSMAKLNRAKQRQLAAEEYNRGLPVGYMGPRKDVSFNPFYGA